MTRSSDDPRPKSGDEDENNLIGDGWNKSNVSEFVGTRAADVGADADWFNGTIRCSWINRLSSKLSCFNCNCTATNFETICVRVSTWSDNLKAIPLKLSSEFISACSRFFRVPRAPKINSNSISGQSPGTKGSPTPVKYFLNEKWEMD